MRMKLTHFLVILCAMIGGSFIGSERMFPVAHAATQATNFKYESGVSGQVITNPTTATFLSVPSNAKHAWIHVKDKPACWGADATAPTASSGGEWPAGAVLKLDNDQLQLKAIRVINCSEGATTVKVYYTRDRQVGQ